MLVALGARLTKELWQHILQRQTDSLQSWLLFADTCPLVLETWPIYTCKIRFSQLSSIDVPNVPMDLVVLLPMLTKAAVWGVVKLPEITMLDLSSCELTTDGLRALDQALKYGRLACLKALCLPRKGRISDKAALANLTLPKSLVYLESPVRRDGWVRCSRRRFEPAVLLQFGTPEAHRAKAYAPKLSVA